MNYFFYLFCFIFNYTAFAVCELDLFPPYPPSPSEFQKPLSVVQNGNHIILSWDDVRAEEGYFVSVCKDSSGYKPLKEVNKTSVAIEGPSESGRIYFLVKAFVKVSESYVFNGGVQSSIEYKRISPTDGIGVQPPQVPVDFEKSAGVKPDQVVSLFDLNSALNSAVQFNANSSFFNEKYPEVTNPLTPAVLASGEIVPPLVTDENIEETVVRVSKTSSVPAVLVSAKEVQGSPVPSTVSGAGDIKNPVKPVQTHVESPSVKTEASAQTGHQVAVSSSKDVGSEPVKVSQASGKEEIDEPVSKPSLPMPSHTTKIIVVILLLICGYLIYAMKEEK